MDAALPPCPHRPPCPGCPRYGEAGLEPAPVEALAAYARAAGLEPAPLREGARSGFRHRARLSVRGRAGAPKLGLFQRGSHRIVHIPRCVVHHPRLNQAAAALVEAIRESGVEPYADRPHRGALRGVQLAVERSSARVQVVLIGNARTPEPLAATAEALAKRLGEALHSLWWNGNPERSNVILGPHWSRWLGPEALCETIGGAQVFYPPGAFGQSNLPLADALVAEVHSFVPDGARIAELYAGCGAIGLGLAARARRLRLNEASAHGLRGLALGLAARPAAERERAELVPGPAGAHAGLVRDADVVIVDPPRKGLDPALRDALCAQPPPQLVYVSCDLASFLRDAAELTGGARLRLRSLTPYALLPYTEHVELVARFEA